jgi:predicted Zn-dependent peptidase
MSDTGLFYIYAGVDLDAQERALQLMRRELERMATVRLTPQQLRMAQRQFIGQMAINNDNGSNEMQSIGKASLNFEHVDTLEEMNADIMNLTPDEVLRVAQSRFAPEGISTLIYN